MSRVTSTVHVNSACHQIATKQSNCQTTILQYLRRLLYLFGIVPVLRYRSPFYLLSSFLFFSDTHRGGERSTACIFKLHDREVAKNIKGVLHVGLPVVTDPASSGLRNGTGFNRVFKNVLLLASGIWPLDYSHSTDQMPRLCIQII
jgi:hypothetical protein